MKSVLLGVLLASAITVDNPPEDCNFLDGALQALSNVGRSVSGTLTGPIKALGRMVEKTPPMKINPFVSEALSELAPGAVELSEGGEITIAPTKVPLALWELIQGGAANSPSLNVLMMKFIAQSPWVLQQHLPRARKKWIHTSISQAEGVEVVELGDAFFEAHFIGTQIHRPLGLYKTLYRHHGLGVYEDWVKDGSGEVLSVAKSIMRDPKDPFKGFVPANWVDDELLLKVNESLPQRQYPVQREDACYACHYNRQGVFAGMSAYSTPIPNAFRSTPEYIDTLDPMVTQGHEVEAKFVQQSQR